MRMLVLGGTSFIGRHLVDAALRHGHEVTLFHRGRTNPALFPQAEHRLGDRSSGEYTSLADGRWDATVDVSGYLPRHVDQALSALFDRQGHYVFVSSVSAYDTAAVRRDEDSPRWPPPGPDTEQITPQTYGPLKAAAERQVQRHCAPDVWAIVRPTYVVGPHDPTDRFTYWVRSAAHGGQVAIAWPQEPVQIIDVRDLADFLLTVAVNRRSGAFDGVGPSMPLAEMLHEIADPARPISLVDVGAALDEMGVVLPLVDGDPVNRMLLTRPGDRAVGAGLHTRSIRETARATLEWDRERGSPPLAVGPTRDQHAALLRRSVGRPVGG
jgi:2'-hydroxyisoflavone reductase